MELDNFAEALDALVASGAGTTATATPSSSSIGCPHASSPSSPRRPPPSRWGRNGRPRGPRRPRRGSPRGVGSPGPLPSAGCAWGGTCATCPTWPRPVRRGAIGGDQARAIASARRHRTEASMARDEEMLVSQAAQMGFEDFYRALSYWKQLADPDGADTEEQERKSRRDVFLEASFSGMWLGQMTLDPVSGTIVAGRAQPPRARPLRGRLRRGQGAPGAHGADRRAGPHLGPAPGRRPRGNGRPQRHRPRRRDPPRPALQRLRRLRDGARCASASSRTARSWPPRPWPRGWTRPTSSVPSSRWATASTSACGPGSSAVGPGGPSSCRDRICTHPHCPPRTARSTTSRPGPRAAPPPKRTAGCSAASTTACATSENNEATSASGPHQRRLRGGRQARGSPSRLHAPGYHPGPSRAGR